MDKLSKLREKMKEQGLDAIVVFDELNSRYLTDYAFTDGYLCISQFEALLVTDFRYYEAALSAANPGFKVLSPKSRDEVFSTFLSDNSVKVIGFEGGSVTYALYKRYKDTYPEVEFVSIGSMIEDLRKIKSPWVSSPDNHSARITIYMSRFITDALSITFSIKII